MLYASPRWPLSFLVKALAFQKITPISKKDIRARVTELEKMIRI
jgi:hypothetical protein